MRALHRAFQACKQSVLPCYASHVSYQTAPSTADLLQLQQLFVILPATPILPCQLHPGPSLALTLPRTCSRSSSSCSSLRFSIMILRAFMILCSSLVLSMAA